MFSYYTAGPCLRVIYRLIDCLIYFGIYKLIQRLLLPMSNIGISISLTIVVAIWLNKVLPKEPEPEGFNQDVIHPDPEGLNPEQSAHVHSD